MGPDIGDQEDYIGAAGKESARPPEKGSPGPSAGASAGARKVYESWRMYPWSSVSHSRSAADDAQLPSSNESLTAQESRTARSLTIICISPDPRYEKHMGPTDRHGIPPYEDVIIGRIEESTAGKRPSGSPPPWRVREERSICRKYPSFRRWVI